MPTLASTLRLALLLIFVVVVAWAEDSRSCPRNQTPCGGECCWQYEFCCDNRTCCRSDYICIEGGLCQARTVLRADAKKAESALGCSIDQKTCGYDCCNEGEVCCDYASGESFCCLKGRKCENGACRP
ncbi:hypothetical protein QR680_008484 [Steinernema hermaphroditum]|uniref:Granulins domain-containing protein n=1 Tax=Steinernema hermaphroditum TaxID=289476 RepID=A0AA39IGR5_9BILA|nr:hypothetical protein QR680_008484 [Steinernema hermaphroditum]